jgi:hypothetical protein
MTRSTVLDLREAEILAEAIVEGGGTMSLIGNEVRLFLPGDLRNLLPRLKENEMELIVLLRLAGGWCGCFPMCPRCAAYCLYRQNTLGPYECQRCGLQGIDERAARMASFMADLRKPHQRTI